MLVLASASPRRRELLTQAGYEFAVCPAHIDESMDPGETPASYVARLAQQKAEAVYRGLTSIEDKPGLTVLGADTTVTLDDHVLGKPEGEADAARMLGLLSGRRHRVLTGIALVSAEGARVAVESTTVSAYIASGEPMDKAGAYAIQGRAARWIPRIEGCYFNVVGLPLARLGRLFNA